MKALLISAEPIEPLASQVVTGLRQRIGTCESYTLAAEQSENLERFFASFVRLSQFDRIVLALPQEVIHRQSMFLRQLPHLCLLIVGKRYSGREKRLLRRNLDVMPWLRVITDDHKMLHWLISDGFDAGWIPPLVDTGRYYPHRRLELPHNAYVYDPSGQIARLSKQAPQTESPIAVQKKDDLSGFLLTQDVFIYWPEDTNTRPYRMIQAMAMGAVVITRNPGVEISLRYRWRDNINCIFASDPAAALEQLHILRGHPEELRAISHQASADSQYFSPIGVGEVLGSVLEPDVRIAADYPRRIRIFGFEI